MQHTMYPPFVHSKVINFSNLSVYIFIDMLTNSFHIITDSRIKTHICVMPASGIACNSILYAFLNYATNAYKQITIRRYIFIHHIYRLQFIRNGFNPFSVM